MSNRRGKVLLDAASIERRKWYNEEESSSFTQPLNYYKLRSEQKPLMRPELKEISLKSDCDDQQTSLALKENYSRRWIKQMNVVNEMKATMVIFPGIACSHTYFLKWIKCLTSNGVQVYSICLPGRNMRINEKFSQEIGDVARNIYFCLKFLEIIKKGSKIEEIEEYPKLVFFGHNLGAIIAFEVGRLIENFGYKLGGMIVSCCLSPLNLIKMSLDRKHTNKSELNDRALVKHLLDLKGIPAQLLERKDLLLRFIPLFKADYSLLDNFKIREPFIPGDQDDDIYTPNLDISKNTENTKEEVKFTEKYEDQEKRRNLSEMPPNLFKLHIPITVLHSESWSDCSRDEASQWEKFCTFFEIHYFENGGFNFLSEIENQSQIMEIIINFMQL